MSHLPDPATVRVDGPWAHRDVHANGIRLHVSETGEGPLALMLHGFGEFWWSWRHQLTALSDAGFRAVAVDLRGYGDSDKPPRGYDAWTLAGDVGGLIKALGERKAHVIGHGWGGMLAWSAAALHPRLVHSVVAIGAAHPLALRRQIRRTALRRKANNQARAVGTVFRGQIPMYPERKLVKDDAIALEHLMRRWAGPQWAGSADFTAAVERYKQAIRIRGVAFSAMEYYRWAVRSQIRSDGRRFSEALDKTIPVPSLRVHGADDPLILPATAKASQRWLEKDAPLHVLAGIGHYPHEEAPDSVNKTLKSWLSNF
ncbi:alpha/beta fold hydrolase [Kibdelosporangium phytohabitans]|uniref:Alpha/beta hydrolase n=1 Tax=Kibdelosporangium phytohabitans TaxID=860235 RepID=A0A0N9HRW8_9PSEU|nr:alpha/beta hydrolase [Kibdelosporangium phytohabitans]ALG05812.1 alpha/beta hydrolase [Kibdelosporangium phytohabitans]MBE1466171.1 pimeloyl-ACP methyl ester carboxylesterase [Kibdelosporangium phytohabitans]